MHHHCPSRCAHAQKMAELALTGFERRIALCVLALCLCVGGCFESPVVEWTDADNASDDDTGSMSSLSEGKYLEEPPLPEYFEGGGYVLDEAVTNVVSEVGFHGELEPGVVYGFNLDGRVSDTADEETCGKMDFTSSVGEPGVDNQLAAIWPIVESLIGDQVTSLLQQAIADGRFLLMLEMRGLDDPQDDDEVRFTVMRGSLVPQYNADGIILPGQTYRIDESFPMSVVEDAQVIGGVLEAGPIEFEVPIFIFDAAFGMKFRDGRLRVEIQEDGTFSGVMAGAVNIDEFLGEILQTAAAAEAELVLPIFQSYADMQREDGECKSFSAAFTFRSVSGFVRYTDEPRAQ